MKDLVIKKNFFDPGMTIIMPGHQIKRMQDKCFRPNDQALAGNFSLWETPQEMLCDYTVIHSLIQHGLEIWKSGDIGSTHSIQIEHEKLIGWSSTYPIGFYRDYMLEEFQVGKHATGLRVKAEYAGMSAPQSHIVTVVINVSETWGKNRQPKLTIHSCYPGKDVGELEGDVSKREGIVFFDWNHPGEE